MLLAQNYLKYFSIIFLLFAGSIEMFLYIPSVGYLHPLSSVSHVSVLLAFSENQILAFLFLSLCLFFNLINSFDLFFSFIYFL